MISLCFKTYRFLQIVFINQFQGKRIENSGIQPINVKLPSFGERVALWVQFIFKRSIHLHGNCWRFYAKEGVAGRVVFIIGDANAKNVV